jgi:type IV pilus assembly protein PilX
MRKKDNFVCSNCNPNERSAMRPSIQSGLAMPMALILLLVMTMLGVSSLRMATLDEDMSSNSRLREIAFNAAETTLIYAEEKIISSNIDLRSKVFTGALDLPTTNAEPGDSCMGGYCIGSEHNDPLNRYDNDASTVPANASTERWLDPNLNVWNDSSKHFSYANYASSGLDDEGVYVAPKYIVEFLGNYYSTTLVSSPCWQLVTSSKYGYVPANAERWPYCAGDGQLVRVTVLAQAGSPEKNSRVMLQSVFSFD